MSLFREFALGFELFVVASFGAELDIGAGLVFEFE